MAAPTKSPLDHAVINDGVPDRVRNERQKTLLLIDVCMTRCEQARTLLHETRVRLGQFVDAEFDLALTFGQMALDAGADTEKRDRNERQARKAYETAARFLNKIELSADETADFEAKLRRVNVLLEQIGSLRK